ncbi:MAG: hypothetical protein B7Z08_11470 [Sphingomonadales bacterium 32-68-7]|nr:MAG: hypothetical protein B7Z08_11470 [Sphingomonadales bacterium 32-68-7]
MENQAEFYLHVRVLVSLVLGLGLTRLLTGLSRFIQHPSRQKAYSTHLVWVATLILTIMHFWWWEFALIRLDWNFALFALVLFYAFLFFLLACLLFPDDIAEYKGFEDYFLSRRRWFFGLIALTQVADFLDTAAKGSSHLAALGPEYKIRLAVVILGCIVAGRSANRRLHLVFAAAFLAYTISWIVRVYWSAG